MSLNTHTSKKTKRTEDKLKRLHQNSTKTRNTEMRPRSDPGLSRYDVLRHFGLKNSSLRQDDNFKASKQPLEKANSEEMMSTIEFVLDSINIPI